MEACTTGKWIAARGARDSGMIHDECHATKASAHLYVLHKLRIKPTESVEPVRD